MTEHVGGWWNVKQKGGDMPGHLVPGPHGKIHMQFCDLPGGWYSTKVLRQNVILTVSHVIATLEASRQLVDRFDAALDHWATLTTSAPLEITMLAEANGFAEAVRTQEYRWAPHGDKNRAHGYSAVATELAQQSDMRFRRYHEHNQMPKALIEMP